MKKIIFLSIAVLSAVTMFAQIDTTGTGSVEQAVEILTPLTPTQTGAIMTILCAIIHFIRVGILKNKHRNEINDIINK